MSTVQQPTAWIDEDAPTWVWEHDPEYTSLRDQRIARRAIEGWNRFANDPETRFARFCNTGVYEPRGPRRYGC
jgi:hypothetical protein